MGSGNAFDIHVCLVSQQPTPNLAPALTADFRPREVVLVVSEEMRAQANSLERVLQQYGVRVTRLDLKDAYDIRLIQEQMLTLLGDREDASIALNVTGGTKPMAIAAQEVFRAMGKPVFYVHPETDAVQFLAPDMPALELNARLKLKDFLAAHGYEIIAACDRGVERDARYRALTQTLVNNVGTLGEGIGILNYQANLLEQNRHSSLEVEVEKGILDNPNWQAVVDHFERAGLVSLKGGKLRFADAGACIYANGGWLESHVFDLVSGMNVQDRAMNVQVQNRNGPGYAKNELDIAVLHRNRLYIIECKTRNFRRAGAHGAEALYKLDSLAALGGLNTRAMLVSYRELGNADRQRAKDLRIKTIEAHQLRTLENQIRTWISG